MAYFPTVIGEAAGLRDEIEGIVDGGNHSLIEARIAELDRVTRNAGWWASFGAEVEYAFAEDPTADVDFGVTDKEDLYKEVVAEAGVDVRGYPVFKGEIVLPGDYDGSVLLNECVDGTFNPDQPGSAISEVKTNPADGLLAVERYWDVINAIGRVAQRNGLIGLILSTHINNGLIREGEEGRGFRVYSMQVFGGGRNPGLIARYVAGAQHNLVGLQALQLDAGIGQGMTALEAFPNSKSASTVVHDHRLEIRHPLVGLADPRMDVLAALHATEQLASGSIPDAAVSKVRNCQAYYTWGGAPELGCLPFETVVDDANGRVVAPYTVEPYAWSDNMLGKMDAFVNEATKGRFTSFQAEEGRILGKICEGLRISDEGLAVDPSHEFAAGLRELVRGARVCLEGARLRVEPEVFYDSEEVFRMQRGRARRSHVVRSVFGNALRSVVSAPEAIARKQAFLENNTIKSLPELEDDGEF